MDHRLEKKLLSAKEVEKLEQKADVLHEKWTTLQAKYVAWRDGADPDHAKLVADAVEKFEFDRWVDPRLAELEARVDHEQHNLDLYEFIHKHIKKKL